jgi:hypothetical protein
MKKLSLIILAFNLAVLAAIFTFSSSKDVIAAQVKPWDAEWIDCEGLEPPHVMNYCKKGSTWFFCANGPCGIMLPGIIIEL